MVKSYTGVIMLIVTALLASANTCNGDSDNPQPEFTSLIGKWQLFTINFDATEQDGEMIGSVNEFQKNGGDLIWEFFSDGRMLASESGGTPTTSNWELHVTRVIGQNIDDGTLTITGTYADQLANALQLSELVYLIETSTEAKTLNLAVDVSSTSSVYKKVTFTYMFRKI